MKPQKIVKGHELVTEDMIAALVPFIRQVEKVRPDHLEWNGVEPPVFIREIIPQLYILIELPDNLSFDRDLMDKVLDLYKPEIWANKKSEIRVRVRPQFVEVFARVLAAANPDWYKILYLE